MELKNCEKCGRTFGAERNETICTKCATEHIEDDFKKVRDFLYDNPGVGVRTVSEGTGVAERIIIKLLRDDRIEVADENNALLTCDKCGVGIKSGRICDKCKNELAKDLMGAAKSLKPEEKAPEKTSNKGKGVDFHIKKRF